MQKERLHIGNSDIILVRIEEWETYLPLLTSDDISYLNGIKSQSRKNSGSAWRAALRSELGKEVTISYNNVGAPTVDGTANETFIGVSHCDSWAALIISGSPCAIDIESTRRNFDRVADRYVSEEEAALPEAGNPLFKAVVWCAKETLYKVSGLKGLDLKDDLRITSANIATGEVKGAIRTTGGEWQEHEMMISHHEECIIVCTK